MKLKKLTALLLAAMMALSLCVGAAWGAPASTTPTYDWYTADATEYTLDCMGDYLGFVRLTQGAVTEAGTTGATNFAGKTVNLRCDVDFAGMDFLKADAAGNIISDWRARTFYGTFDATKDAAAGTNYTIKNLTCTIDQVNVSYGVALFRSVYGTIKNLNVENITVNSASRVNFGGVAQTCPKNEPLGLTGLYNCHVSNVNLTLTGTLYNSGNIGGLAGRVEDYKEVKNCTVADFTISAPDAMVYYVGGLIGWFYIGAGGKAAGAVENCKVDGFTVDVATLGGRGDGGSGNFGGIGGMLGYGHSGNEGGYAFPIADCTVKGANITIGQMDEYSFVGGFMGMSRRPYKATNCSAEGTITVGGNVGSYTHCYVGGFCGSPSGGAFASWTSEASKPDLELTNCSARINVTAGGTCTIGGFAGVVGSEFSTGANTDTTFTNCTSGGAITSVGTGSVGGFAGKDIARGTYDTCGNGGVDASGNKLPAIGLRTSSDGTTAIDAFMTDNASTADMPGQTLNGGTNPYQVFTAPVEQGTSQDPITVDLSKTAFQPTREGYTFKGWADENGAALTGDALRVTLDGTNNTTFYALWEKIPEPVVEEQVKHYYYAPITQPEEEDDTISSPKTFDGGVAVYAALGLSSLLGLGYVRRKKK